MPGKLTRVLVIFIVLVGVLLAAPHLARADTKLFLKDGSYQLVKSYEVHGDRVRYYSVERSQWEEIPAKLVDFDLTNRTAQQEHAADNQALEHAKELEKERFDSIPVSRGFEVAPGIHLPSTEGVYAFDGARVVPMIQSSGEVVTDKKRMALNIALPGPLLKKQSLVVLDGAKAAVRILVAQPTFYIQSADSWGAKAELIPVKTAKENRVVEKIQAGIGMGKSGEIRDAIPVERQQVAPGLYKLRPTAPLKPGEYALAEMIESKLNLDVWDFGIEGAAKRETAAAPERPAGMTERPPGEQQEQRSSPFPLPRRNNGPVPGPLPVGESQPPTTSTSGQPPR